MKESFLEKMRKNRKWNEIRQISLENCVNKTGQIEAGIPIERSKNPQNTKLSQGKITIMGFGKYKEKTREWVQQNDPSYWQWCCENIKNFKR